MIKSNMISLGLPFLVKNIILFWDTKILNFFANVKSFLPVKSISKSEKNGPMIGAGPLGQDMLNLSKEEVKMVMNNLGIYSDRQEDDLIYRQIGEEEILGVFDEEEPNLEELKEAFGVFDENKDGFIDSSELGRVLCSLGLPEEEPGMSDERLRTMMKAADENKDGLVDFSEFVKFMEENCFF